jgi:gliding motility-associated protein GldC
MEVKVKKKIGITVGLDENNLPVQMWWEASENPNGIQPEVKAMFLSMFDKETKDTLKLDLWTKDFQTNEMDRFVYHTIRSLADSYFKATGNKELANQMQHFAEYFGEKVEILAKEEQ